MQSVLKIVTPSCRAQASDCCALGPFPVGLAETKRRCIQGELFLRNYSQIKKKKVFLSLRVNFWEILTPSCRVVVSDCRAPGPVPDGLTERGEKMHSGRVIVYPCVITLKSRCWNICTQADGREKPPKDCLRRTLPGKWRAGEERRIRGGEKSEMKRWEGIKVDTRSSRFKRDGLMSSQIQWLISRQWWRVEWRSGERRVCTLLKCSQIVILNCVEMSHIIGLRMTCAVSGVTDCQSRISELIWI